MNVAAIILSDLKKKRAAATETLAKIDAALAVYGGGVNAPVTTTRTRRRKERALTPEQIAKMQAGRVAARAEKAAAGRTDGSGTETHPARESHPRLPQGPKPVPKGASLADAAS